MTDDEIKQMCIIDLIDNSNNTKRELAESECKRFSDRDTLEDLYFTLCVYKELYSRMLNSDDSYEEIIGEYQHELLNGRSRMRMFMFNVAAEFLEYIYIMSEEG